MIILASFSLALNCAPVQSDPLVWFPKETALVIELNPQTWVDFGETTYANQLFELPQWDKFLPPLEAMLEESQDDPDVAVASTLLAYWGNFNLRFGVPLDVIQDARFWLTVDFSDTETTAVIEELFMGAPMKELSGGRLYSDPISGTWFFKGNSAQAVLRDFAFEEDPTGTSDRDAEFLLSRLAAAEIENSFAGRPEILQMRGQLATQSDFINLWISSSLVTVDGIAEFVDEPIEEEIDDFFKALGWDKLKGIAWTTSIDPPYLTDRFLAYGPGLGSEVFPSELLEANDVVAALGSHPSDTAVGSVNLFDYVAVFDCLYDAFRLLEEMSGSLFIDEELEAKLEKVREAVGGLGPMTHNHILAEDLWNAGSGSVWIEVSNPVLVEMGLSLLPDGMEDLLKDGLMLGPNGEKVGLRLEDDKLVIMTASESEVDDTLDSSIPWQEQELWMQERQALKQVVRADWMGPEVVANGFEILRDLDDPSSELSQSGINLSHLPDFGQVIDVTCGMAVVHQSTVDGYLMESRSPLGIVVTSMFAGAAQVVAMMEGVGVGEEF